ncbi:MAG: xanthine dehydrogenase family protein subunit M [bacterium]|nr:xanthine dehydrogenase family protein subunit M [bacterium]MCP5068209.1 xanthine dehydrogenase family protein subunit M [bacterium]
MTCLVEIPTALRALCEGELQVQVPVGNVRSIVRALDERFPGFREQLGQSFAVAIDGELIHDPWLEPVPAGTELHFLPVIAGGQETQVSVNAAYAAPEDVEAAVALLAEAGSQGRVLAGGTDLIVQMRTGQCSPQLLVDVKRIPALGVCELGTEVLRLGAALSSAVLREQPEVRRVFPGLVEAAELIGSEQVQGRASLGGNLCNGSPAADTVPALIVADATCIVAGPTGMREVPVAAFCTGPGETVLGTGELLVELRVPRPPARTSDAYLRFTPRSEMDIAVAGAAARLELGDDGRCRGARVAIGAVAPTALLVPEAAEALVGSDLGEDALEAAAAAVRAASRPIDDVRAPAAFRTHLVGVLSKRVVRIAASRAAGEPG